MDKLTNMRLFALLSDSSQEVTNEEMQNAYAQFVAHINAVSNSDDKQTIFRMLNLSRIEMAFIESLYQYGQGEKCPEKSIL